MEIRLTPAEYAQVRARLALAAGDDVQGLGLDRVFQACEFRECGALALALVAMGRELWIQGAGGADSADLTQAGLAACEIEARGRGLESVGFQTRRRGLVKKAIKAGYEIDGYILRKRL